MDYDNVAVKTHTEKRNNNHLFIRGNNIMMNNIHVKIQNKIYEREHAQMFHSYTLSHTTTNTHKHEFIHSLD